MCNTMFAGHNIEDACREAAGLSCSFEQLQHIMSECAKVAKMNPLGKTQINELVIIFHIFCCVPKFPFSVS